MSAKKRNQKSKQEKFPLPYVMEDYRYTVYVIHIFPQHEKERRISQFVLLENPKSMIFRNLFVLSFSCFALFQWDNLSLKAFVSILMFSLHIFLLFISILIQFIRAKEQQRNADIISRLNFFVDNFLFFPQFLSQHLDEVTLTHPQINNNNCFRF